MEEPISAAPLSQITLGRRHLRLTWLKGSNTLYLNGANIKESLRVLFVAADVLTWSSIPAKNHCRIHARYAKDGLATKVAFNGNRPLGCCSTSMWFYSIKGLFKIAFEYLGEEFQKFCLVKFKDIWISAFNEAQLPEETSISHLICTSPLEIVSPNDRTMFNIQGNTITKHESSSVSPSTTNQDVNNVQHDESDIINMNENIDLFTVSVHSEEEHVKIQKTPVHDLNKLIDKSLQEAGNIVKSYKLASDSVDYRRCDSLLSLLTFYRTELLCPKQALSVFTMDMIRKYNVMCQDPNFDDLYQNDFNIESRRNAMLCIISDWLGNQFRLISPVVEEKVLAFKKEHIGCIDNLPPAREIIDSIFPQCMSSFVYNWLARGEHFPPLAHTSKSLAQPSRKRSKINHDSSSMLKIAPLAQIILEFANNTLISGVAHVVYAQVMQAV